MPPSRGSRMQTAAAAAVREDASASESRSAVGTDDSSVVCSRTNQQWLAVARKSSKVTRSMLQACRDGETFALEARAKSTDEWREIFVNRRGPEFCIYDAGQGQLGLGDLLINFDGFVSSADALLETFGDGLGSIYRSPSFPPPSFPSLYRNSPKKAATQLDKPAPACLPAPSEPLAAQRNAATMECEATSHQMASTFTRAFPTSGTDVLPGADDCLMNGSECSDSDSENAGTGVRRADLGATPATASSGISAAPATVSSEISAEEVQVVDADGVKKVQEGGGELA